VNNFIYLKLLFRGNSNIIGGYRTRIIRLHLFIHQDDTSSNIELVDKNYDDKEASKERDDEVNSFEAEEEMKVIVDEVLNVIISVSL